MQKLAILLNDTDITPNASCYGILQQFRCIAHITKHFNNLSLLCNDYADGVFAYHI